MLRGFVRRIKQVEQTEKLEATVPRQSLPGKHSLQAVHAVTESHAPGNGHNRTDLILHIMAFEGPPFHGLRRRILVAELSCPIVKKGSLLHIGDRKL